MRIWKISVAWQGSVLIIRRSVLSVALEGLLYFMLAWLAVVLEALEPWGSSPTKTAISLLLWVAYGYVCRLGAQTRLFSAGDHVAIQNYGIWRRVALGNLRGFRIEQVDSEISENGSVPANQRYYVVYDTIYGQTVRVSNLGVETEVEGVRSALHVFNATIAVQKQTPNIDQRLPRLGQIPKPIPTVPLDKS